MVIDEVDQCPKKDRESFAASRWRIHQTAFISFDGLPCFLLEPKRDTVPGSQPISYHTGPTFVFSTQRHSANLLD
jgi:hypothetical protein